MKLFSHYFIPNEKDLPKVYPTLGWVFIILGLWQTMKPTVFPSPLEVIGALPTLWADGLGSETFASFTVNLEALALSSLVGLPIAYLSRTPALAPLSTFLSKFRFAGSAVFFLPLLMVLPTVHAVKVGLLMLGELFYLVTTMSGVVQGIPEYRYDDARTLKMGEWLSIWYVNIRGTVAEAIDAIRDNAGMGWSMLMFVEGVVRSEGGIGVIILNAQKHVNYDEFFAAVLIIVVVGIAQDWFLSTFKRGVCPYA